MAIQATQGHRSGGSEPSPQKCPEGIAIVGMGCRWPGGVSSSHELWEFLMRKGSGYTEFTDDRLNFDGFYHPDPQRPGSVTTRGGHFLQDDPRKFDNGFFGIPPPEVMTMDPTQRKLLEVTYEAFENAGVPWSQFSGSKTGVFVGNFNLDHSISQSRDPDMMLPYATTGQAASILSNRISFAFNLHGPSVTMDTACSSSLYALHIAVSAIRNGDCDAAIVAGSNLILTPDVQLGSTKLGALSATSLCHTFDASADGYSRSEGFGALYLTRVSDALESRLRIRAVIRGTAINSNAGITHPSSEAQEAVIRQAFKNAGDLDLSLTGYFECHGTGTPVGDPLEVKALGRVFALGRSSGKLPIGSIKTNIGHTESASGIAGVMKAILALEHGVIPPTIGVRNPNPNKPMAWPQIPIRRACVNSFGFGGANAHCILDAADSYLPQFLGDVHATSVNTSFTIQDAKKLSNVRKQSTDGVLASVSELHPSLFIRNTPLGTPDEKKMKDLDSGYLSEAQLSEANTDSDAEKEFSSEGKTLVRQQFLLPFSAYSQGALEANITALASSSTQNKLIDIAHTLSSHRSLFTHRAYAVVDSLIGLHDSDGRLNIKPVKCSTIQVPSVGFIFTGQGAQWASMGAQLFSSFAVFRKSIHYLDSVLAKLSHRPKWNIEEELVKPAETSRVNEPEISQTVCTALQIGLVDLLRSWKIEPVATVGHSSGEIAAAYAAGRHTAAVAILMAYLRGQSVKANTRDGRMLAAGLSAEDARSYIRSYGKAIQIAAVNSPSSVTISGDTDAILDLQTRLQETGIFNKVLRTKGQAYHSHHMAAIGASYQVLVEESIREISSGIANSSDLLTPIAWFSSVDSSYNDATSQPNAAYWRRNMEGTVEFERAVASMMNSDSVRPDLLIEIGPNPALKGALNQIRENRKQLGLNELPKCLPSLTFQQNSLTSVLQLAGELFMHNAAIDLGAVNALDGNGCDSQRRIQGSLCVDLPPYKWDYGPIMAKENRFNRELRLRRHLRHDVLGARLIGASQGSPAWRNILRRKDVPWLDDHKLLPETVFPTAGYIAMAIEAASQLALERDMKPEGYSLRNLVIKSALKLPDDDSGVETMFDMQPLGLCTGKPSRKWFEFTISSWASSTDSWSQHCCGQVAIEPSMSRPQPDALNQPHLTSGDIEQWYDKFSSRGLGYGPYFRRLSNLKSHSNTQVAMANIPLTAAEISGRGSNYILHPGAIDAALQLGLIAAHSGQASTLKSAFVPLSVDSITIWKSNDLSQDSVASCVADSEFRGLRGLYGSVQLFDQSGNAIMDIKNMRAIIYTGQVEGIDQQQYPRDPFSRVAWKPDIDHLTNEQAGEIFPPVLTLQKMKPLFEKAQILTDCITLQISNLYKEVSRDSLPIHLQKFSDWIQRRFVAIHGEDASLSPELMHSSSLREKTISLLFEELSEVVEVKMLKRLYKSFNEILRGETSALQLSLEDDILTQVYETGAVLSAGYEQFARILDVIAHKNPRMKIVEIGAGTGGATERAVEALQGNSPFARYKSYSFTDVTSSFLAAAEVKFGSCQNFDYGKLDIGQDPAPQGFSSDYDLALAFQCLHATPNISETVKNVRRLLKPGGRLVILEGTRHLDFVSLIFGMFPDFWEGAGEGRVDSAFITRQQWQTVLLENGFSGIDIALDDVPAPYTFTSTIVARAIEPKISPSVVQPSVWPSVFIVHSSLTPPPIAEQVVKALAKQNRTGVCIPLDEVRQTSDRRFISLLDFHETSLLTKSATQFALVRDMIVGAQSILWVSNGGLSTPQRPSAAMIQGILTCAVIERPSLKYTILDLESEHFDDQSNVPDLIIALENRLQSSFEEGIFDRQYIMQSGRACISRIVPDTSLNSWFQKRTRLNENTKMLPLKKFDDLDLNFSQPGLIESLYFTQKDEQHQPLDDDFVEFQTKGIGLNLRDLTVATARYDGKSLSLNCSGVVRKIGKAVKGFQVGDRVWGFSPSNFSTVIRAPVQYLQKMSDSQSFASMSGLAVPYATAVYALMHLGRVAPGEKVLIESATGGLGMAALRIAKHLGADIFVTVGTEEKRRYIREKFSVSDDHIFSSRDESVLAGCTEATNGKGFDVILCSAAGDRMHDMWRCIAPLGRFIEVGRTDVHDGAQLAMEIFRRNATFSSFDVELLFSQNPELGAQLLSKVNDLILSGAVKLEDRLTTFDIADMEKALLFFSTGNRIGRVSITYENPEALLKVLPSPARATFDPSASYLLVGGLGGLGRSISTWMVQRGARNLVYLSRSGVVGPETQNVIDDFKRQGVSVKIVKGDVGKRSDVQNAVAQANASYKLKGVLHAAMDLKDISFEKTSHEFFNRVINPKVAGTVNLHEATKGMSLDFFVMTSSIAGLAGSATQSAYGAANSFQDQFARWRRAQGLCGTAFAFGLILGAGTAVEQPQLLQTLERNGMYGTNVAEYLELAEAAFLPQSSDPGKDLLDANLVVGFEPSKLVDLYHNGLETDYHWPADARLSQQVQAIEHLALKRTEKSKGGVVDEESMDIDAASPTELPMAVGRMISKRLSKLLFIAVEEIDFERGLSDYGMDSMIAAELRNWLFKHFGLEIAFLELLEPKTKIRTLVERSTEQMIKRLEAKAS